MTKLHFTHYNAGGAPVTANQLDERASVDHFRLGLLFAVGSALAFGSSGPFAKALMEAGWSPTAAVVARLAGGALVMAVHRADPRRRLGLDDDTSQADKPDARRCRLGSRRNHVGARRF